MNSVVSHIGKGKRKTWRRGEKGGILLRKLDLIFRERVSSFSLDF